MHVFMTGATGWVGTVVVKELLEAGHRVTGLARSQDKAAALAAAGAGVLCGSLDDLDMLARAAAGADAVIHAAFNNDFSRFAENSEQDRRAIEVLGRALEGSNRPLLATSGVALVAMPGRASTEHDEPPPDSPHPRKSEAAVQALQARGVRAASVRLALTVHGQGDHGFVPLLVRMAREKGVSAYIGDGMNRWPAVNRHDAARIYRLALEKGAPEPAYHAVAEEGIAFKDIAEAIGRGLAVPVEPRTPDHFGWFAAFAGADMPSSSARTRELLHWNHTHPGLLADLAQPWYFSG